MSNQGTQEHNEQQRNAKMTCVLSKWEENEEAVLTRGGRSLRAECCFEVHDATACKEQRHGHHSSQPSATKIRLGENGDGQNIDGYRQEKEEEDNHRSNAEVSGTRKNLQR